MCRFRFGWIKVIWLAVFLGGALLSLIIFVKFRDKFKILLTPLTIAAGLTGLLSGGVLYSHQLAKAPLDLSSLEPKEQIHALGCLSCHTISGIGFSLPGGPMESVSARDSNTMREFLSSPDKATPRNLISATGQWRNGWS